ncbi:MAG: glutamate formiminotransferase [Candidatus Saganbacteria bacterium]|uniref:glutamate formimidoyltransferase n=1 Tax=Candidatus Saganbacteria bacterium TaxID=2575572 RepID=A0A833P0D2_UNCSA|nr:MAG: glutamate formiminotransferase [Candidatus Saganbacteria bacterium]
MVGDAKGIRQAAIDLTQRAVELLDIREHKGVHPFIGVVDVVPFVPLNGSKISEAVEIAHEVGEKLWEKLKLPVYFYGEAAKIAERKELPYIRRGGYKALANEIHEPHRVPDVGYGLHLTAGAAAVGARDFLIAFNVNLKTKDIDIAKSIAKNIREKDGGLPGVRALGMYLETCGTAQVSVNITSHKMCSLQRVFDEIKMWAIEYNVEIIDSELVGMIPEKLYSLNMKKQLRISNFSESLILKEKI